MSLVREIGLGYKKASRWHREILPNSFDKFGEIPGVLTFPRSPLPLESDREIGKGRRLGHTKDCTVQLAPVYFQKTILSPYVWCRISGLDGRWTTLFHNINLCRCVSKYTIDTDENTILLFQTHQHCLWWTRCFGF